MAKNRLFYGSPVKKKLLSERKDMTHVSPVSRLTALANLFCHFTDISCHDDTGRAANARLTVEEVGDRLH